MPSMNPVSNAQKLTKRQRRLLEELREIASLVRLNYNEIADYDPEERTTALQVMKRQIVVSEVVSKYTLIDEFLSVALCNYFFGRKRSEKRASVMGLGVSTYKGRTLHRSAHVS